MVAKVCLCPQITPPPIWFFYKLQCDLRLGVKNKGIHLSNHQNKSGNHCKKKKKLKDNLRFVRKRAVSYGSTLKKKEAK